MNKTVLCAALAGVLAAGMAGSAYAADMPNKEKCYGIAKAGKNDCKSMSGSHSCAGHSTKNYDPGDFKVVNKGQCEKLGGSLAAPEAAPAE
ncbi:MAG: DUF2282 domain-containing protein [Proteobacteria bacterium]|nr:DUF2282 domain-containing protein [Pseudomonadota bacterium]